MAWPTASDYFEAVQNPLSSFTDEELRQGEAARNDQGMPILYAGNFASVFQIQRPAQGRSWAIKCFTRKSARRQERYRHISAHLQQAALPFTVPFVYLEQGIRIGAEWYPILKMDWVDGQTLNQFVGERLDRSSLLRVLCEMWVKLAQRLHEAQITHADLQHGNIMLIPGSSENRVALRLVDYDGMYLPALQGSPSGELGHPTYQSPQRLSAGYYGPEVDRFSHLVIYTALRALTLKGRALWQAYDNGDNLLFTHADFKNPRRSKVLQELWQDGPDELRFLAGRLALAAEQPLAQVPQLQDVVEKNVVRPLTASQMREVAILWNGAASVSVKTPFPKDQARKADPPRKALADWPGAEDFRSAVLLPSSSFVDADLRQAVAVPGGDGLPVSLAGSHGIVFPMRSVDGRQWAVKCFTSMVAGRQSQFETMANYLEGRELPFLVSFEYLEQGIRIREEWYPVLKMEWVDGQPLNQFVGRFVDQPSILRVIRDSWERLAQGLKGAELTHGDLQPSNILVVAGDIAWRTTIKLVDYDGMRVPELLSTPTVEGGHPVYQHPKRATPEPLNVQTDHFGHLVIYTALRALVIKGASLWRAYDKGENLLFCVTDFRYPWASKLLQELWHEGPDELRFLAGRLALALEQTPAEVPPLNEVLAGANVHPLTVEEISRVQRILAKPDGGYPTALPAPPILSGLQEKPKPFWVSIAARLRGLQQVLKKKPALLWWIGGIWAVMNVALVVAFVLAWAFWGGGSGASVAMNKGGKGALNKALMPLPPKKDDALESRLPGKDSKANVLSVPPNPAPREAIVNSVGMKLVRIEPGKFLMGSPMDDEIRGGDEYQHEVEITRPFYIGIHELTRGQWQAVMGNVPGQGSVEEPVSFVSWQECHDYCRQLSALEKKTYELPTEAEWEYACRAGTTTRYHFGDTQSEKPRDPNPWGLYGVHDKVWEWCADWYERDYYRTSPQQDPKGPDTGIYRIQRGGWPAGSIGSCRSASRGNELPGIRIPNVGVRVVLRIDPAGNTRSK